MHTRYLTYLLLLLTGFTSCALREEADMVFPKSPSKLFVEGYLSPGQPIRLSLIRSSSFQEDLSLQLEWYARVEVILPDTIVKLQNILYRESESGKIVNYASSYRLPAVPLQDSVRLRIVTEDGKDTLYAATELVAPVSIEEWTLGESQITVSCANTQRAGNRYYGLYLQYELDGKTIRKSEYYDYSQVGDVRLTFRLDVPPGKRPYRVILYRITPANYTFQRALQRASRSNVDPFEPPVVLPTNVRGGQGMFTYSTADTLEIN